MEKIIIDKLSFKYPLSDKLALDNIKLAVNEGEFIIFCGKSGCGKTTLLRHLKKQSIPHGDREGNILVDGVSIFSMEKFDAVTKIGYLYQNPDAQIVTDKVWHELAFGLESLNMDNKEMKRKIGEMSSYFGIQNWFDLDTSELSGGQKQILNLASIMVMNPEILILDEPTSQLDPIKAKEFMYILDRINKDFGTTIIMSEHRLEDAMSLCTRIGVLDEGKLIVFDDPKKIHKYIDKDRVLKEIFSGFPAVMQVFINQNLNELPIDVKDGKKILSKLDISNLNELYNNKKRRSFDKDKEVVLKGADCWFKYTRDGKYFLRGLNIDAHKGEIFGVLGGNGSGKTTLLRTIGGELKMQRGSLKIKDKVVVMVPQNPQSIFTELTVGDELYEGVKFSCSDDEEKVERVISMLDLMELSHLANNNPYDISGGEQQRLAIGKLLLREADILLLDEPTKALDSFFKSKLGKILTKLKEDGKTIIMVSHDIEFCANYADRCTMFFNGELIGTEVSHSFFKDNNFYTTTSNRLCRDYNEDIVTVEEAKLWLRGKA